MTSQTSKIFSNSNSLAVLAFSDAEFLEDALLYLRPKSCLVDRYELGETCTANISKKVFVEQMEQYMTIRDSWSKSSRTISLFYDIFIKTGAYDFYINSINNYPRLESDNRLIFLFHLICASKSFKVMLEELAVILAHGRHVTIEDWLSSITHRNDAAELGFNDPVKLRRALYKAARILLNIGYLEIPNSESMVAPSKITGKTTVKAASHWYHLESSILQYALDWVVAKRAVTSQIPLKPIADILFPLLGYYHKESLTDYILDEISNCENYSMVGTKQTYSIDRRNPL